MYFQEHDESFPNKWLRKLGREIDRDNVKTKLGRKSIPRREKFQREYDEKDYDFDERGEK